MGREYLLNGKGKPILLHLPLNNHGNCKQPIILWNSRITSSGLCPKDTPPQRGGGFNSTTIDKNTPTFNTPLSPITESAVNMPHQDNLPEVDYSVDKPSNQQIHTKTKYNLRRAFKATTKLDL